MSDQVRIDVARSRAMVEATRDALATTRHDVDAYAPALQRYLRAPSDLPAAHHDHGAAIDADREALRRLVDATAHLADLLETLDSDAAGSIRSAEAAVVHPEVVDVLDDDLLERLRDRTRDVFDWLGRVTPFDEIVDRFPELVTVTIDRVETVVRRTTIVIDEVVDDAVRRTLVTIDEIEQTLRRTATTFDLEWLRRSAPWLRRLGQVGDALAGGFAGWEQWEEDAGRDDLTSTERVLRAGGDAVGRGGAQALVGTVTGAAAGAAVVAAPFTLGGSLVVGGLVIAGGVVAGEALDPLVDDLLSRFYETQVFASGAEAIDDLGRGLRRGWDAAAGWGGDRVDDLRSLPGVADRVWDDGWELGREGLGLVDDLAGDVGDWASGVDDWAGDRLGDLAGALSWG